MTEPPRFWVYGRESWEPEHRWQPFIGGDEWDRYTLVLPIPFGGYLVTALWRCRLCLRGIPLEDHNDPQWLRWLRRLRLVAPQYRWKEEATHEENYGL